MNNDKPSSESSPSPTEQPGDAKHTRGPWMYDKNPMMIYAMYGKEYIPIAVVSDEEIGDLNEVQANAELIARAPALLSEVSTLRSKQAELIAEIERLKATKVVFENCTFTDKELQSENARLKKENARLDEIIDEQRRKYARRHE